MSPDLPATRWLDPTVDPGEAQRELVPIVYHELHAIARRQLAGERAGHTLQTTALVHEAYLRLLGDRQLEWQQRTRFYVAASEAMRRVLLDHARRRRAHKRGNGRALLDVDAIDLAADSTLEAAVDFDAAVAKLAEEDARAAEVVRLRFYAGLDVEETASLLGVSRRTVLREWAFARARLHQLLAAHDPG